MPLPILVFAAARDLQRPPERVNGTFGALGSADKTFVRADIEDGYSVDFGHDDLLAGRASPDQVFPIISDWLDERSRPRSAPEEELQ